jgi:hypothetical protein
VEAFRGLLETNTEHNHPPDGATLMSHVCEKEATPGSIETAR